MPFFKGVNLLYIHVPKTGGMSIEEYFYNKFGVERNEKTIYGWYYDRQNRIRVEDERSLQHFTYEEICTNKHYFDFEENPDMQIIISVRNPFDRLLSDLFWSKKITVESDKNGIEREIYNYLYVDIHDKYDNHKLSQHKFILNTCGELIKNIKVIKTETLKSDMHRLGYYDFESHINKNRTDQKIDYKKLLNHNSIKMIQQYYAEDFKIFDYPTDQYYNATIVTAFISNINNIKNRSLDTYIEYGKKLLSVPNPKIVFIDAYSYNMFFKENADCYPTTTFVVTQKEDIYLYNYKDELTDFYINTGNPEKDSIDYLFVQCNKTEWVTKAIDMNKYKTEQFIWIDFGIYHMINDEEVLRDGVLKMTDKSYDCLHIASCKYKGYSVNYNVYEIVTWTFSGSVFGGNIDSLLKFASYTKSEIIKTIRERKSIMWEINIWYLIYRKNIEFFDFYVGPHDNRILYEY